MLTSRNSWACWTWTQQIIGGIKKTLWDEKEQKQHETTNDRTLKFQNQSESFIFFPQIDLGRFTIPKRAKLYKICSQSVRIFAAAARDLSAVDRRQDLDALPARHAGASRWNPPHYGYIWRSSFSATAPQFLQQIRRKKGLARARITTNTDCNIIIAVSIWPGMSSSSASSVQHTMISCAERASCHKESMAVSSGSSPVKARPCWQNLESQERSNLRISGARRCRVTHVAHMTGHGVPENTWDFEALETIWMGLRCQELTIDLNHPKDSSKSRFFSKSLVFFLANVRKHLQHLCLVKLTCLTRNWHINLVAGKDQHLNVPVAFRSSLLAERTPVDRGPLVACALMDA